MISNLPNFLFASILLLLIFLAQPVLSQCTFTVSNTNPCPGEMVTFTVINPMAGSVYKWDTDGVGGFNNGTGTSTTFTYPYAAASANFMVTLEKDGVPCPGQQTVIVKAGVLPILGVASGGSLLGNVISSCSGSASVTLSIYNNSTSPNNFTGYSINWGDGSLVENYNNTTFNANTPVTHVYSGLGYKTITLTGTYNNGCVLTNTYQFFNGTNPAIGMGNPGGAVGLCAPHTLTFPLSGYENNPPGTMYIFRLNGMIVGTFDQNTIQPTFSYTFTESSCGQTPVTPGYMNSFEMSVTAENPCYKSSATIVPITLNSKPIPDIMIQEPSNKCPGEVWTFMNATTNIHEILPNGSCVDTLNANWSITPGQSPTDWQIVSGGLFNNNKLKIRFNKHGTYIITMTLNPTPNCGPATITKTITVLEPPDAIAEAQINPTDGCAPLTVKFKNNSTGYQVGYNWHISPSTGWSWQAPNSGTGDIPTPEPTAVFTTPGTYMVTLTASNVCTTDTWVTQIVVKGKPTVTLPNLGPFCIDATLNFTAPTAPTYGSSGGTISNYQWSFPGGTPNQFTGPNPTNIKYGPVTMVTSFTYTVSVTNECGTTTATKTFEIQVPATISLPPDITVCANTAAFQITPVTPSGGMWSGPGVSPSGLFNPANAGSPGVKTLTYTYGSGGTCVATKSLNITVVALPVVNAGIDLKKCVSDPAITLGGTPVSPPGTGTWTSSPATPGLSGLNFNPANSGAGTFTLSYTYTDVNNCKNTDQLIITVNNLPGISVNNASFCNLPGLVPMPTATPAGGTWSGPGVTGNQFDPVAAGIGTHIVTYTYTDPQTMCSNTKTATITVGPPENINAGPDKVFCKNDPPYDLNADATNSNGGTWSGPGVSGSFFDPGAVSGTGQFTIKLEKGAANCLVFDERIITVNPIPIVSVPAVAKSCIDETEVTLPSTSPASGGNWTSVPAGLVVGNIFHASIAGTGDFTLTYTYTDPQTLCTNSDDLVMTVNPLPVINVGDTIYCNTPGAISLPFATPGGGTWSGPGITGNQFNPVAAGGIGNYTATYAFTNQTTGCNNEKDINIEVISPENIDAGPDKVFCQNDPVFDLDADATNSSGGVWSGPGTSGHFFTPSVAGAGTHTIVLKKGPGNCQVVDERIFKVNPLPAVDVPATAKSCISETMVQLPAPTQPAAGGGTWTSTPPGLISGTVFNAKFAGQGTFTLTYTYTDNNNCTNSDALTMTVNPLPVVTASDAIFCNTPGSVPLPAVSPSGGTWSGAGVSGNSFDPNSAGGVGIYQPIYTYTDINNCTNRDTAQIEVIAPETIDAGEDKVFCLNDPPFDLDTDATNSIGGTWSGPGVSGNFFTPAAAGPGTHTIVLKKGVDNCEVIDQREIKVNPLPVVDVPATQGACVSETDAVLPATTPPSGGIWSSVTPGLVTGNIFHPALAGAGNTILTYAFTDAMTGCKNSDSLVFTTHALPVVASQDTTFCNTPGLVNLPFASPNSGGMGWWTGNGVSSTQFNPQGAGGVGMYPVTYHFTDAYGCTDSVIISINVIEPIQPIAGSDDTICIDNGLLQLTGFSPTSDGQWSGPGIMNATTGIFDPIVAGGGLHELDFAYGVGNCELHDKKTVLVIDVAIEAGPDKDVCLGDSPFTLTGFSPATGGIWAGPGITNPGIGDFSPSVAGEGEHHLYYEFKDPILGCTFRDSLIITVNPMPQSAFPQPTNTCINEPVMFENMSQSTFDVLWDFGDGNTSTLPSPTHTYTTTGTFTVKLVTQNEFGCMDMVSHTIFVTEPPNAFFTLMPDTGCAILKVSFINQSSGFEPTYFWQFGNFQNDTLFNPGIIAFPGGTKDTVYHIRLEVTNLCATRIWEDSILVHPLPIAIFGTSTDTICSAEFISFTNISLGQADSFEWDFGNGQTSTDSLPPALQYFVEVDTLPVTYTIRLIAKNYCGNDTVYHEVTVKPLDVSAFFNVPNLTVCQFAEVQFNNFATPGASVFWDFGDGNTSSDFNPTHIYLSAGQFKVVQKATDGCGYDSAFAVITVLPAPDVSFDCEPQICKNELINFMNTSLDMLSGLRWDFGDGDTSVLYNPSHIYEMPGLKKVTLIGVSAENGCSAQFSRDVKVLDLPSVQFSANKLDGCVPLTVNFQSQSQDSVYYEWDFGDGNTQTGPASSHIYQAAGQYEVKLHAIDLNGCTNDTLLRYITVYPIPTPDFEMVRDHLCGVPVTVEFKNNTPDAVSYQWLFGDVSGPSALNNPSHTYDNAGDYQVSLIAKNAFGCLDTITKTFSAYAQPVADFGWAPEKGCVPLKVHFENLSTDATTAQWLFSDGGVSDSLSGTNHSFYQSGEYGATLIVSHRGVCFDTLELSKIIEVLPSPTANFLFAETVTTPPSGMFTFTDLSVEAARWFWEFGDGDTSNQQNPMHRYYQNGPQMIRLTVWGANGCPDDTVRIVTPMRMSGLFIPDAFTPGLPNGDASKFLPKGVGLAQYHIAVYSSYGTLLWQSEALSGGEPAEYWDGTFKGEPMPQDVYTWKLINAVFDDGRVYDGERVGSVTLIR